jgi:hypothetical protein
VQAVRWEGGGTELARKYTFFYGKRNKNHEFDVALEEPFSEVKAALRVNLMPNSRVVEL